MDRIHSEGLQVNLVMNPTCEGADWYSGECWMRTLDYSQARPIEDHGVESVTIANPLYVQQSGITFPTSDLRFCPW